jgi:hypothetical protein
LSVIVNAQPSAVKRRRVLSQAVSPVNAVSMTGMTNSATCVPRCAPVATITANTNSVVTPSPRGAVSGAATSTTSR